MYGIRASLLLHYSTPSAVGTTEEHQRNCMLTDTPTPKGTKHHHQLIPLFKLWGRCLQSRELGIASHHSRFAIERLRLPRIWSLPVDPLQARRANL